MTERTQEIIRLYVEEQLPLQQIGDKFNLTRERIRQILQLNKIPRRVITLKEVLKLYKDQILDLHSQGLLDDQISQKLNISLYLVKSARAKLNLSRRVNTIETIKQKLIKSGDCLLWSGFMNGNNICITTMANKQIEVHKLYLENLGKRPKRRRWRRVCSNPRCVVHWE